MTLRKLVPLVPIVAALALAAPVASAHAATTPVSGPGAIPCYPYPAFCGPSGQPWFSPPAPISLPGLPAAPVFNWGAGLLPFPGFQR